MQIKMRSTMILPATLLLTTTLVALLALASAVTETKQCTAHIIKPLRKDCYYGPCEDACFKYDKDNTKCPADAEYCTWEADCVHQGCSCNICIYHLSPASAPAANATTKQININ